MDNLRVFPAVAAAEASEKVEWDTAVPRLVPQGLRFHADLQRYSIVVDRAPVDTPLLLLPLGPLQRRAAAAVAQQAAADKPKTADCCAVAHVVHLLLLMVDSQSLLFPVEGQVLLV